MVSRINVNQDILLNLHKELSAHLFDDYCFRLFNIGDSTLPDQDKFTDLDLKHFKRQQKIIASSERAVTINNAYISYYASHDSYFNGKKLKLGMNLWNGPSLMNKPGKIINNLYGELDVQSIVTWVLPTKLHWYGVFNLFSHQASEQLNLQNPKLASLLELYSQYFTAIHTLELNPIVNYSIMSKKSIAVLTEVASGKTLSEISNRLNLTQRGVCYHIDKLKEAFDCVNRSQLVDKAHRLGLL